MKINNNIQILDLVRTIKKHAAKAVNINKVKKLFFTVRSVGFFSLASLLML